ncbi:Quinone oxidoreductase 2 [Photobacterium damselae subsp. piscicida]|uniref:Quinone oxidoreductase 2 n=1 Tax=Photobacterium damsela subsp. piscicida TaxID=38294 RepID=A0A1V1VDD8_PHODP|nr:SDR family oxidoreductase [Photobacterium damselae]MBE8127269.1 SDR family oxidoreductase [Photobacterium damselae subsp. piscicida]PSV62105.1 SDR family NAD(P)-dependent oxidoreductase [Photobacterium damselae]PSW76302.1 SDR family NAD(P)-dependent oxidoreductase [Photobacterium damselae]QOD54869.1 SDR family oxidoreductase [Photobacterium damselae subsp. piscicida]QOD58220.1 SDR family oxidoreductase [Photobacterium damselae subsp. piscicida]
MSSRKLLVTGASGKFGSLVVEQLLEKFNIDPTQLIVTTRDVNKLKFLSDRGVDVREADFAKPESLVKAFTGADSMLFISIDANGPRTEAHLNAVNAAEMAGIRHISYTSMGSADKSPVVFAFEHEATEQAIAKSNIQSWTILRNNWYFENFIDYFASIFQTGFWLTSSGEGKVAQISREDLAYAAAASIVNDSDTRQVLSLNGSDALTAKQMLNIINDTLDTNIQLVPLTDDEYRSKLASFGLPEAIVELCVTMDEHNRKDLADGNDDDFMRLTGKRPQSFSDWLINNKKTLVSLAEQSA